MFLDLRNAWPPPEPWEPKPEPRMTKRQERMIGWIVGANLLLLLVGPLAGSTVFDAIAALLSR